MPALALVVWRFAKPLLPYIAAALALLAFVTWIDHRGYQRGFHRRDAEVSALSGTIANMKAASEKATAANLAYVATVQAKDEQTRKEQTDALSQKLVDARTAVAGWVRAQAIARNAGSNPIPRATDPASAVDGAGASSVVPVADLQICAEAVVKAQGWRDWYSAVAATAR